MKQAVSRNIKLRLIISHAVVFHIVAVSLKLRNRQYHFPTSAAQRAVQSFARVFRGSLVAYEFSVWEATKSIVPQTIFHFVLNDTALGSTVVNGLSYQAQGCVFDFWQRENRYNSASCYQACRQQLCPVVSVVCLRISRAAASNTR